MPLAEPAESVRDGAVKAFGTVQWDFIPRRRTPMSNTLFSIPYPGVDVRAHPVFVSADVIHLHWPTWGVTPRALGEWLDQGRAVFWTLHDCWPMTGGCHYTAGCEQYKTHCMVCPQLRNDMNLVSNAFADRLRAYGDRGALSIIAPSQWMADMARGSALLRDRPVTVVRNPVELDVFRPPEDRAALRAAFGVRPGDFVLFFGSHDFAENRKGVKFLFDAVKAAIGAGKLAAALPAQARVFLVTMGQSSFTDGLPGVLPLNFGNVADDAVLADIFGIADLVCVPSLEDNYPNVIVEAMACGTPCLGTPVGGIAEMIEDGVTGILAGEAGSAAALARGLVRFARDHFGAPAMRAACRVATERTNDPAAIGRQLRGLYEAALGRPLAPVDPAVHLRRTRAFANSPVRRDTDAGRAFLQFPTNLLLSQQNPAPQLRSLETPLPAVPVRGTPVASMPVVEMPVAGIPVAGARAGRHRLVTLRTYHSHHSARSGPYQFLRHLDSRAYTTTHLSVPLGTELVGARAEPIRRAGALLGARAFGQQGNAWMPEAEIVVQCAAEPVDLVHFIDGELGGWLMPLLPDDVFAHGRRPALLTTFHQPPAVLERLINAEMLGLYDGIIALCGTQKEFLERHVEPGRVFLVPHGIDTGFFHPAPVETPAEAGAPFRLLLVGHWLRDLDAALAAFRAVRAHGLDAELTIIAPNLPARFEDAGVTARSGLSDEELREAYRAADLVFLPLRDATANNAVLEAMACGRPIVSTDVGGVAEMVGEGAAILCPVGDARALAEAVIELARSPERRRAMGLAGRRRAEGFDWTLIARRHQEIYRTLIARRTGTPCPAGQEAEAPAVLAEPQTRLPDGSVPQPAGAAPPDRPSVAAPVRTGPRKARTSRRRGQPAATQAP